MKKLFTSFSSMILLVSSNLAAADKVNTIELNVTFDEINAAWQAAQHQ